MKLVIVAIGLPGSGKTTLLAPLANRFGLIRISRDEIRKEWYGDPLDRSDQGKVWEEANRRMTEALAVSSGTILDSTFAERHKRIEIIQAARVAGADRIVGLIFDVSPTIAKARNQAREHVVKEEVIDKLHRQLVAEPPALNEGFDALYTSDQLAELEKNELSS